MNTNATETHAIEQQQVTAEAIPAEWLDERDEPFFRITATLFSADFCFGAGVLLASYDDENGE